MCIVCCYIIWLVKVLVDIWVYDFEKWNYFIDSVLRDIVVNFFDLLFDKFSLLWCRLLV